MSRVPIAWHEGGHALAAVRLGIPLDVASIRPGAHHAGVVLARPGHPDGATFDLDARAFDQHPGLRASVERELVMQLAGERAELLAPRDELGYTLPEPCVDPAVILATLAPRHRELLADAETREHRPDAECAAALATAWIGDDAEAASYVRWLTHVADRLLRENVAALGRVARALLEREVLDGDTVAALAADRIHPGMNPDQTSGGAAAGIPWLAAARSADQED